MLLETFLESSHWLAYSYSRQEILDWRQFHVLILYICVSAVVFNSLSNDKILTMSTLKVFVKDKLDVAQITKSVFERAENMMGKRENAGYQHFLFYPSHFQKIPSSRLLKLGYQLLKPNYKLNFNSILSCDVPIHSNMNMFIDDSSDHDHKWSIY